MVYESFFFILIKLHIEINFMGLTNKRELANYDLIMKTVQNFK